MSVRLKIILVVVFTIIFCGGIVYFVGSRLLITNYLIIEREEVVKNLERVNDAIENVYAQLGIKLIDWTNWDDTYKFVKDKNSAYIKSNLLDGSLQNLQIQGMFFYDTKGKLVYSKTLESEKIDSKSVEKYFSSHQDIILHNDVRSFKSGIILLPEGALFVASRPIVTSEGEGPIRGAMVFVKVFGKEEVENIQNLTHVPVEVFPYNSSEDDIKKARQNLSDKKHFVDVHTKEVIDGYSKLLDITGSPVLIVEVHSHRTIVAQGQKTTLTFMMIAGLFALFFGVIIILLLEKLVIRRLKILGVKAREIGRTRDLSKKIIIEGRDEIAELAQSINAMLVDLKNSEDAKEEALKTNEKITQELTLRLEEIEKINNLMVGRELRMIELKKALQQSSSNAFPNRPDEKEDGGHGQSEVKETSQKKKLSKGPKK